MSEHHMVTHKKSGVRGVKNLPRSKKTSKMEIDNRSSGSRKRN